MISKKDIFALAKLLEGLPVVGTLGGTPAARAGVRYGDVVLSVNGARIRTVIDYIEASSLDENGMSLVVFRGGEEISLELVYDADRSPPNPALLAGELLSMRILPSDTEGDDESS